MQRTLAILIVIMTLGCHSAQETETAASHGRKKLDIAAQQQGTLLSLVYTSDWRGEKLRDPSSMDARQLEKDPFYSRVAFLKNMRHASEVNDKNMLVVDSGNDLFPFKEIPPAPLEGYKQNAILLAKSMAALDYDAVGVGQYDLVLGVHALQNIAAASDLNLINANVVSLIDSTQSIFPGHAVFEASGFKIGVFSLISKNLHETTLKRLHEEGYEVKDPADIAPKQVSALLEKGVSVIVMLSSMPWHETSSILQKNQDIDIAVVNGGSKKTSQPIHHGQAVALQLPPGGNDLGLMRIVLRENAKHFFDGSEHLMLVEKVSHLQTALKKMKNKNRKDNAETLYQSTLDKLNALEEEINSEETAKKHLLFNMIVNLAS